MDLTSLFQRLKPRASATSDDAVQIARTRARRRLIGASVLLVVGVVTFPLLFETKPRPLPMDTPIGMAAKPAEKLPESGGSADAALPTTSGASAASQTLVAQASAPAASTASASMAAGPATPVAVPALTPALTPAASMAVPSGTVAKPAAAQASAAPEVKPSVTAASGAAVAAAKPETPVAKPEPKKPEPKKAEPKKAEPKKAEPQPASKDQQSSRFVVQVGAFADASSTREARSKAEKLGLKTYTQDVDTPNGKRTRVRVGPFTTREEAQKAAAKLRAANLQASVLTL